MLKKVIENVFIEEKKWENVFLLFLLIWEDTRVFCTTYPRDQNLVVRVKKVRINVLIDFKVLKMVLKDKSQSGKRVKLIDFKLREKSK